MEVANYPIGAVHDRGERWENKKAMEKDAGIVIESYAFIGVATRASGPTAQVWLPPGYTLTAGGAYDMGRGPSNIITACYPTRNQAGVYTGWAAAGRDFGLADPVPLAVYAIGVRVLKDGVPVKIDQQVFSATSALVSDPGVSVKLAPGWIGTGGGAQDNYATPVHGNMLTDSFPLLGEDGSICGWSAAGRDPDQADQARVTAFVIGIRSAGAVSLAAQIVSSTSALTGYPSASVNAPEGRAVVAGGGALSAATGKGAMLSASCPLISSRDGSLSGWYAARKIERSAPQGAITAYGVMLEAA